MVSTSFNAISFAISSVSVDHNYSVRIELQKQKRAARLATHEIDALKRKNDILSKEISESRGKFRAESRQIELIRQTYQQQLESIKADLNGTVPR